MCITLAVDRNADSSIHMGGVYGDKPSTLARFKENYVKLGDHIKRRLVLENDEVRSHVLAPLGFSSPSDMLQC